MRLNSKESDSGDHLVPHSSASPCSRHSSPVPPATPSSNRYSIARSNGWRPAVFCTWMILLDLTARRGRTIMRRRLKVRDCHDAVRRDVYHA